MRTFFNFIFTNNPARISPKEISGASGGFLPKPLLLRLRHPNSKKISRVFCEILSPKNSYRKTESALVPPPARILGGQNTKEKCPFLFRKNWSRANPKSKEHFSLVSAESARRWRGFHSSRIFDKVSSSGIIKTLRKAFLAGFFCWIFQGAQYVCELMH